MRINTHGDGGKPHAIVKGGAVVNIVLWNPAAFPDWRPADGVAIQCGESVGIGHIWDGTVFINPTAAPGLDDIKSGLIGKIDHAFRSASAGLFVDDAKRDQMRAAALSAVAAVDASDTAEKCRTITAAAVSELEASKNRVPRSNLKDA